MQDVRASGGLVVCCWAHFIHLGFTHKPKGSLCPPCSKGQPKRETHFSPWFQGKPTGNCHFGFEGNQQGIVTLGRRETKRETHFARAPKPLGTQKPDRFFCRPSCALAAALPYHAPAGAGGIPQAAEDVQKPAVGRPDLPGDGEGAQLLGFPGLREIE